MKFMKHKHEKNSETLINTKHLDSQEGPGGTKGRAIKMEEKEQVWRKSLKIKQQMNKKNVTKCVKKKKKPTNIIAREIIKV